MDSRNSFNRIRHVHSGNTFDKSERSKSSFRSDNIIDKYNMSGRFDKTNSITSTGRKLQMIGEFTLGSDEKMFKVTHPAETGVDYTGCDNPSLVHLKNNGPKYTRPLNPYEKMVNLATIGRDSSNKITFKAKAFYEKAKELSKDPANAKMDNYNPIFYYIANPSEYRFYKYDDM